MIKFQDYLNEQLQDPEFKEEYDKLEPEYEIIKAIIDGRSELNLTQKELAKAIGTSQGKISKLETGNYNPSLNFLKRIAEGLGKELHISFLPKSTH